MVDHPHRLTDKPATSTPAQRQRLVIAAKRKGLALDDLRVIAGGSLRALSAAAASSLITQLTGESLPNPPGRKPPVYPRRKQEGVVRMISDDLIDQIARLSVEYLGSKEAGEFWLQKNFGVTDPWHLQTAERAGRVVWVLKQMHERKEVVS